MNWEHIKTVLSDKTTLGLNLLFIFIVSYIVITGGDHRRIKLFLIFTGLFLLVFFVKKINQPLVWYLFLAILISDLISDYFVRANHHFLLIYLNILIIVFLHNSRLKDLVTNIKFLVVIVLLFSGVQKLVSLQFTSGDFYYYMLNTGGFFKPILYFSSEMNEIVISNKSQIAELGHSDPNELKIITFQNILPHLDVISRVMAWTTILMELVVAILILWKPKHNVTHILFILLILAIFFTRFENGFLTILAITGVWLSESIRFRFIYTILAIVSLSFMLTKIGFY